MTPDSLSIQEGLYPGVTCFGCGHANPKGLHLRSYAREGVVVAAFTPWPEHDNGFGFLNGGIITTVLDCHTAAAVLLEAHERGWKAPDGAPIPFITAGFDVRFLRPTPLDANVELQGKLVTVSEDEMVVDAELSFDAKVRATMRATWKRFKPRTAVAPQA
jgi:acyl-coenzyme A thioesterase PaaI-like protein